MDNLEVLTRARARVNEGWIRQVRVERRFGPMRVCALGGIDVTVPPRTKEHRRASFALWRKLPLRHKVHPFGIPLYNDLPWRTKTDILKLYDKAIKPATRQRARRIKREEKYHGLVIDQLGQIVKTPVPVAVVPEPVYVVPAPVFIAPTLPVALGLLDAIAEDRESVPVG